MKKNCARPGVSRYRRIGEEAAKLGANAVVGIYIDYEVLGDKGGMLMVSVSGTAVRVA